MAVSRPDTRRSAVDEPAVQLEIDIPDSTTRDERAVEVLAVMHTATAMLERVKAAVDSGEELDVTQATVDGLETAFRVGQRLLDHPRYEAFLMEGPGALPEGLQAEIRSTIVPVGEALGVDMTMTSASDAPALSDFLPTVGTRGS